MNALAARALGALLILALVFGLGIKAGTALSASELASAKAENARAIAKLQRDHADVLAGIAAETDKARKAVIAYFDHVEGRFISIASDYEKGKYDAYELGRSTAAAVRRGDLRLRDEWTGCPAGAASAVQAAGAAVAPADAAAEYRAESLGRIRQAAREHDDWATSCVRTLDAIYGVGQ